MLKEKLENLMLKYKSRAIVKGGILLLKPLDALKLADEIGAIGVFIGSVELWYYMGLKGEQVIVEDPYGPEFYDLLKEENGVQKSVEAVKHYLSHDLPERIAFVSFVLDTDEPYWEILKQNPSSLSEVS